MPNKFDNYLAGLQKNNPEMTLAQIIDLIAKKTDRLSKEVDHLHNQVTVKTEDHILHCQFLAYLEGLRLQKKNNQSRPKNTSFGKMTDY